VHLPQFRICHWRQGFISGLCLISAALAFAPGGLFAAEIGDFDGRWTGYIDTDCSGRAKTDITIKDGELSGTTNISGTGDADGKYNFSGYVDRKGRLTDGRLSGMFIVRLSGQFESGKASGRMSSPDCHGSWRMSREETSAPPNVVASVERGQAEPTSVATRDPNSRTLNATARQATELGLDLGRFHAVIIGNNNYAAMPDLKTAITDARAIGDLLARRYGFEVQVLENVSRHAILSALAEQRATLQFQDSLLIYYAGHGVVDPITERGYWLPVDADAANPANWISNADIADMLKAMPARHVLVIADSCYSGTLMRAADAELATWTDQQSWLAKLASKRSRTALTSGGVEPVSDSGSGEHSVFAKAVLDVLRDNENIIDAQSLFGPVRRQVLLNAAQTPQYADVRFTGHEGGDFIFVPRQ